VPGRTAHQALAAFIEPMQRVLSCTSSANVVYRLPHASQVQTLTTSEAPIRLRTSTNAAFLLSADQQYQLVWSPDPKRGPWKVQTRAYRYRIDREGEGELVSWHWHPPMGVPFAHMHTPPAAQLHGLHLPTGRVSLEAVVRLLLAELDVRPCRQDWREVLDEAEDAFRTWRTWG
jgi:hypothetical protein